MIAYTLRCMGVSALFTVLLWNAIAWPVFQIRHPKAGQGAYVRYWWEVVTYQSVSSLE